MRMVVSLPEKKRMVSRSYSGRDGEAATKPARRPARRTVLRIVSHSCRSARHIRSGRDVPEDCCPS